MALIACDRNIHEVKTENEGQSISRIFQIDIRTKKKNGWHKVYYENQLIEECEYSQDTLHGLRVIYQENRKKEIEERYEKGIFHGLYQRYYPSGKLKIEGLYLNGKMEGNWRQFYNNGQLKEIVAMHQNEENGPFIEYYPNGFLKAHGSYYQGDNENGLLWIYDSTGILERKMVCNKGFCHTIWHIDSIK